MTGSCAMWMAVLREMGSGSAQSSLNGLAMVVVSDGASVDNVKVGVRVEN